MSVGVWEVLKAMEETAQVIALGYFKKLSLVVILLLLYVVISFFFSTSCFAFMFSILRTKCILPTKRQRALLCLQSGLRRRRIQLHRYLCTKVSSMLICPRCLPWQQKYYAVDYVIPCKNTTPVESRENIRVDAQWGCRDGAVVRALASHQCGPGSIPRSGVKCELSFVGSPLCTERFSPGTPVSPLLKNQNFTWFVLIVNFIVLKAVS